MKVLLYEDIKEISAQAGVLDIVVEKDYVLDWVLWGISQIKYLRDRLVFKGGTALHKMYFPDWRFSEDLDFTTIRQIEKKELQEATETLCEKVKNHSGIKLRQRNIEPSGDANLDWSYEIKIEYIGPRRQTGGSLPTILLHITNDELLLNRPINKIIISPYKDIPSSFSLLTYSLEEILAEKIRTIFHQRCWPRDIYDTWRLLRDVKDIFDIEKVLDIYHQKTIYRGFEPGTPSNIDERILRIKKQWKEGLQRQVGATPDFDMVYPEVKELLEKLFNNYITIKKGGITMLEITYSMKYKKGDLEIEVQGDRTFVEEKFKELLQYKPVSKEERPRTEVVAEAGKKMSLSEFIKIKNPKSHGDKILVFGYFLEKTKEYPLFTLNDIETCYKEARLPKTKNFRPYITRLIRDGYLVDAEEKKDNKKAWTLTDSGLKYVETLTQESE